MRHKPSWYHPTAAYVLGLLALIQGGVCWWNLRGLLEPHPSSPSPDAGYYRAMTEDMLLAGLLGAGIPAILALVFGHVVWAKPKHQSEQRGGRGRALIGLLGGYGYFVMVGLVLLLLGQG